MNKQIFKYFNGKQAVYGDPLELYERLQAELGGELDAVEAQIASGWIFGQDRTEPPKRATGEALVASQAASVRLREAVRIAFGMVPFNPLAEKPEDVGATAEECDAAYEAYMTFLDTQKKSTD